MSCPQSSVTVLSGAGTPIATAVPPRASIATAWATTAALPVASKDTSTPAPSVRERTAVTGSSTAAATTSVAPRVRAISSLAATRSIAISRVGARQPRALEGGQPDAAEADHGDRVARQDGRGVDRGADAGGCAATEEARRFELESRRARG